MKKVIIALLSLFVLIGCASEADIASHNLSKAANEFEVNRRVVFYNGITGEYILSIEGLCSLDATEPRKVSITCKTGKETFKKHYLGVSDNVTYFIEQLEPQIVNGYRYRVIFKPLSIVPELEMKY